MRRNGEHLLWRFRMKSGLAATHLKQPPITVEDHACAPAWVGKLKFQFAEIEFLTVD